MIKRITSFLILIVVLSFLFVGCALRHQLKEYVTYQLHDIKCEDNELFVLLEKKRSSPEVSLSKAMLDVVPTGTRYRLISYSLLRFDKKNISEKNGKYIKIVDKVNIVENKNIKYMNKISIIDSNRIISWSDFINDVSGTSLIYLDGINENISISNSNKSIYYCNSFDNKKFIYLLDDKIYIYDVEYNDKIELADTNLDDVFVEKFKKTHYMTNDGKWFFDLVGEDLTTMSYIFEIINKETNVIFSKLPTKSKNIQDFNNKLEGGKLLTYDHRYGLEIIDLKGNSLYSLQDESLKYTSRAVLDEDKVYAAGIITRDTPLGKKEYIEIIQWDYKNDSVIKKYYPCDSPELEM